MQIKNRKSILIIFLLGLFSFNLSLYAEEFDISAKEVAIDNASQILIGTGSVMAKDSEGKIIYADKITYKKLDEFLLAEGNVKISDNDETLIFCSDLIPLKSHVKIPWIMGYDLNAELTMEEKEIFLSEAADNDWILFFYHDPRTIAVKIKKNDRYFEVVDELRRK